MKKITLPIALVVFTLTLWFDLAQGNAQAGLFGICTQDKVIKFIDAGLTKGEIVKLCSTANAAKAKTTVKKPQPAKVQTKIAKIVTPEPVKALRGNLAALNGIWTMDVICEPASAYAHNVEVKNGKFIGVLDAGADALHIMGQIEKDGTLSGYGTGTYVLGEISGKITDWKSGKGSGTIIVGGEGDCEGTWTINRKR
ncbi:MAG: hypothetical protein HON14_15475 [Rhodospirillaceae bacterium]|nr:hypothetical protein [Rhodospirillaceae bacterium]MBT4588462.1 hypothetical protein [Rhodospirillaceae bacterium]MBT4940535.1 hypothetical protein [Rhodospirillaceae bacterium]MBT5942040.1 hypothetical protein [Rhodospirillaceae bacterium]MBT7267814.1 hypothetical protein [Rhodospirillaceae bacterium]